MSKESAETLLDQNTYELGYLFTPLIAAEAVAEAVDKSVLVELTRAGANRIEVEVAPRMTALAYPIKKSVDHKNQTFQSAYFGALRFTAPAEVPMAVANKLRGKGELIRFLIIRLPNLVDTKAEAPAAETEINNDPVKTKEAIDKEIEDLVSK